MDLRFDAVDVASAEVATQFIDLGQLCQMYTKHLDGSDHLQKDNEDKIADDDAMIFSNLFYSLIKV